MIGEVLNQPTVETQWVFSLSTIHAGNVRRN